MNDTERIGLKSLRRMVSNSEIVIVLINISGCFAVMSLATYELVHSSKNKVVPFSKIKSTKLRSLDMFLCWSRHLRLTKNGTMWSV